MLRRSFLGWLMAGLGWGAVNALPKDDGNTTHHGTMASVQGKPLLPMRPEGDEKGLFIKGVGILRYPEYGVYPDGKTCLEVAEDTVKDLRQGCILALPSVRDGDGHYLWDFRIEGDDVHQVKTIHSDALTKPSCHHWWPPERFLRVKAGGNLVIPNVKDADGKPIWDIKPL